ncbi:1-phosphatidylinositol 4-kinase [Saccharomycopsis crataegensis]|uniref:Phosphatidylinositol 4-kinase n=1 Tax=Saccharomycopsis crataegensis TaxID=43959 RepID=A0AAV5QSB3_9ASCO|nr:1-phosphatidylinositol 4-kinase [Saccharomycopsis crataegensis]
MNGSESLDYQQLTKDRLVPTQHENPFHNQLLNSSVSEPLPSIITPLETPVTAPRISASSLPSPRTKSHSKTRRSKSLVSLDIKVINDAVLHWKSSLSSKFPHWYVKSSTTIEGAPNEIYYSVFKQCTKYPPLKHMPPEGLFNSGPTKRAQFDAIVEDAITAKEEFDIEPQIIPAGSSGSYFIYSTSREIVGVFKPKDEEPYGPLSPKWAKWIHRNLFPFFFGRSCLIPNLGYICEAATSLLDRQLQTHIVPYSDTVFLSSPNFYYKYFTRRKYTELELPKKVGSFQLFLHGYMEADKFFKKFPFPGSNQRNGQAKFPVYEYLDDEGISEQLYFEWAPGVIQQFREELEKLVILDYIIRNTDRGLDNWMIGIEWVNSFNSVTGEAIKTPKLKIGAIDSGLSWPWKHPDEWRSFPFGWLFLPLQIIGNPFSENTRKHFLPILTSVAWWEESKVLFRQIFSRDDDFKERMWKKQWAVMKGQAFNVVECLKNPSEGPLELARRTRVVVLDDEIEIPVQVPISTISKTPIVSGEINSPLSSVHYLNPSNVTDSSKKKVMKSKIGTIPELEHDECVNGSISNKVYEGSPIDGKSKIPISSLISINGKTDDEDPFEDNYEVDLEELNILQSSWTELLHGVISDQAFESTKNQQLTSNESVTNWTPQKQPGAIDTDYRVGLLMKKTQATKRMIVEKLEPVTSKPPLFTWC